MLSNRIIESSVQDVMQLYTIYVLYVILLAWKCRNVLPIKDVVVLTAVTYLVIISNTKC